MVGLQRALAAAFLAALALSASANDAAIRLERVSLYQLARLVLGELLHEAYVLDGSLIASEDVATVDVGDLSAGRARVLLEAILRARGFALEREAGVTVVKRLERPSEPESMFVYRPKF